MNEMASDLWRRRLVLPAYKIADAARYADVTPQTVAAWHKPGARKHIELSNKAEGAALSYMQLIEVAVVAAFRKARISLNDIRDARNYLSTTFTSEFPFAEFEFKRAGKRLLIEYEQVEGTKGKGIFLRPDQGGQLVWEEIFGALQNFDYEGDDGIVLRWHVAGRESPVVIDPRISFGAPTVRGTPTWILKGRWDAHESLADIAEDFDLEEAEVREALRFEGVPVILKRPDVWTH